MPAGFYRGKNRLIPATGKNLPTLTVIVMFVRNMAHNSAHLSWLSFLAPKLAEKKNRLTTKKKLIITGTAQLTMFKVERVDLE